LPSNMLGQMRYCKPSQIDADRKTTQAIRLIHDPSPALICC
jgi:hypothetical protein